MKKYNKEDIQKGLSEIQEIRKSLDPMIPLKVKGLNHDSILNECDKRERILEIELAVAELQEKCK